MSHTPGQSGPRFSAQLKGRQFPLSADARTADSERRVAVTHTLCVRLTPLGDLLIGGEKTGDDRWAEKFVPTADRIFERHLIELKEEGNT